MFSRGLFAFTIILLLGSPASAGEVRMEMRNQSGSERFVYEPDFIRVLPGDTVVFVPIDKGHNAVSIGGFGAGGDQPINVGFNKEVSVTFDKPGIYGVKCTPHVGLGMVGIIVVGEVELPEEARASIAKLPPKARQRLELLLGQVGRS